MLRNRKIESSGGLRRVKTEKERLDLENKACKLGKPSGHLHRKQTHSLKTCKENQ